MISKQSVALAAGLVAAAGLAVVAQSPGDIKAGKVYVSGENPVIRLFVREGADAATNVSFWRVVFSPAGLGHVCYVTSDPTGDGATADDIRLAFTHNPALLDYLNKEIMSAFDKSYAERPLPSRQARFEKGGDTMAGWKETIVADAFRIELVWKDFYEPFLLDTPTGGQRNPYGITSMYLPARSAEVWINGKKAAGRPTPQLRGSSPSSSAFLAFSETWVR
jgi:hypothetical protein